jgi:DNA-binding NarL/FixJ family response regulator
VPPAGEKQVRVLVVDDHEGFRTGLAMLLEEHGFDAAEVASGEAALNRLRSFAADVVVMDLNMPGMSGIEATRRVLEQSPARAVLVLTGAGDEESVLGAVRAGAAGYLLKDAELHVIVAGIRAAAAGAARLGDGSRVVNPRARDPYAAVARLRQRGDRRAALPLPEHRERPSVGAAGKARRREPGAGRGLRDQTRPGGGGGPPRVTLS